MRCRLTPLVLGDSIEGEAREVARVMAVIARQTVVRANPFRRPLFLLSGGETTVTVRAQDAAAPTSNSVSL